MERPTKEYTADRWNGRPALLCERSSVQVRSHRECLAAIRRWDGVDFPSVTFQ